MKKFLAIAAAAQLLAAAQLAPVQDEFIEAPPAPEPQRKRQRVAIAREKAKADVAKAVADSQARRERRWARNLELKERGGLL